MAFYSGEAGRNAVTSNLAIVAVMGALCRNQRTVLFENHYAVNNIEQAFFPVGQTLRVREENGYLCQEGLDSLMRNIHSGVMKPSMLEACMVQVMKKQVYYLPGSHIVDGSFFSHEFGQVMRPLFSMLESFGNYVFVDVGGKKNASTQMILAEADLVVANLSQNPHSLKEFFDHHSDLLTKTVFLIGNYEEDSKFNRKNIARDFPIDHSQLAVIPRNVELHDAIMEGKLVSYLTKNYRNVRGEKNYRFMRELKQSFELIYRSSARLELQKEQGKVVGK